METTVEDLTGVLSANIMACMFYARLGAHQSAASARTEAHAVLDALIDQVIAESRKPQSKQGGAV